MKILADGMPYPALLPGMYEVLIEFNNGEYCRYYVKADSIDSAIKKVKEQLRARSSAGRAGSS